MSRSSCRSKKMSYSSPMAVESIAVQHLVDDEKRESMLKTFEKLNGVSNSLLSLTTQWKDLESHFKTVVKYLKDTAIEMEAKSKQLDWRSMYLQTKRARLEKKLKAVKEKEDRSERRLRKIRREKKKLHFKTKNIELREQELDRRESEVVTKENEVGVIQRALTERYDAIELEKKSLLAKTNNLEAREKELHKRTGEVEAREKRLEDRAKDYECDDCAIKLNTTMDGRALQIFLSERVRDHDALRDEVACGLSRSSNPPKLVLDAMKGFYIEDSRDEEVVFDPNTIRKSCILVLEQMSKLRPKIMHREKDRALQLAFDWKQKMHVDRSHYLEVVGFLQLVASFELVSVFDKEELAKLFKIAAHHDQAVYLCHRLGIQSMIPEIIQSLIEDKERLVAIKLIYAFELDKAFPPVPILEGYLKYIFSTADRICSEEYSKQEKAVRMKLAAIRDVSTCITKYNVELTNPLQRLSEQFMEAKKELFELDMVKLIGKVQHDTATELVADATGLKNITISKSTSLSPSVNMNEGRHLAVVPSSWSEMTHTTIAEQAVIATTGANESTSSSTLARMNERQALVVVPSQSEMLHNTEQVVATTRSENTAMSESTSVRPSTKMKKKRQRVVVPSEADVRRRIDHPS